ncbi:MAG TPA: RagB/SusD family nutrient uptake outer membrane protein [Ohtaekwangia sp.]|uniref:RagB/SusD family nutrient uptake outer membrane protein n=1 Tax=Ohtaekwangia sp. TaxID=2066019 RepID=UPI002F94858E
MKHKNVLVKLMALVLLVSSSCSDFLNEDPQTALTQEEVYAELDNIEPLILGLYTSWRNTKKDRGGFIFSLGSDESQQGAYQVNTESGQAGLDRYDGFLAPSNTALGGQWDSRWLVIGPAAQAIYSLRANQQDPVRKNQLIGEAAFIRASLTFEMAMYWGEVPVIDLDKVSEYGTARQPLPIVYGAIEKDLLMAIEYLPADQSDKRRATKTAAQAMLGKVYLYAPEASGFRDYAKAKEQFEAVINSGKYSLISNVASLWDPANPNPAESIFSFQFNNIYPDNNQIQWQMGSRACANLNQYCYFGGYDLMVPTKYCYSTTDNGGLWEDGDQRKDVSIRYDFTYNGNTPVVEGWMGGDELDPHVKKYEDIRLDGTNSFWYSGKNVYLIRFADILLNYAETLNETGNTGQAVIEVNKVRARAWGGSLPADKEWNGGMSASEFRTKIMDERMRELCFEGWRRMDLIRTGNLVSLVKARNKWTAQSGTIQEFHNRYPIPQQEILQNEDIDENDQNPGYANQ